MTDVFRAYFPFSDRLPVLPLRANKKGGMRMRGILKIGDFIGGHMPIVAPLCVTAGVLFPQVFGRVSWTVPYLFALITFQGSLNVTLRQIGAAFRHPRELACILATTIVVMPALARVLAGLVFSNAEIICGIVIEYSIPVAVVSFMWIDIFHGNASLGLAAVIVSTVLAPFTIPVTLQLLMGVAVTIDAGSMMRDLAFMVALPAVAGVAVNELTAGWGHEHLSGTLSPFCRMLLLVVITCNATGMSSYVLSLDPIVLESAAFILLFASLGFVLGIVIARLLDAPLPDLFSITFCTGLRNISSGSVIATEFFPGAVIIPVMMGTLFQQILAAVAGSVLRRMVGEEQDRQRRRLRFTRLLMRSRPRRAHGHGAGD